MQVTVRYMAQLKQAAGAPSETLDLVEALSVQDLLVQLTKAHPNLSRMLLDEEHQLQPTILVFRGDDQVDNPKETTLMQGDTITLLSPIAGG